MAFFRISILPAHSIPLKVFLGMKVYHLGEDERDMLKEACQNSKIHDTDEVFSITDKLEVTKLHTSNEDPLPQWVVTNYRKGCFPKASVCMLVSAKYVFDACIKDTTRETCVAVSLQIRRYIYRILSCDNVTEYCKVEQSISSTEVKSIEDCTLPILCDVPSLSARERKRLLYGILGCDDLAFQLLAEHWKLVLAATVFWNTVSQLPPHLVKSLLLCFLVCHGHSAPCLLPPTALSSEWKSNLHWLSQWRSCYKDAVNLNKVLNFPVPITCPSQLYNGKLVMKIAMLHNFDQDLLGVNVEEFHSLLGIISSELAEQHYWCTPQDHSDCKELSLDRGLDSINSIQSKKLVSGKGGSDLTLTVGSNIIPRDVTAAAGHLGMLNGHSIVLKAGGSHAAAGMIMATRIPLMRIGGLPLVVFHWWQEAYFEKGQKTAARSQMERDSDEEEQFPPRCPA